MAQMVKASAYNAGDSGSIPGSGRSPGEGNGNPLQYSCLENPMDRGAWWAAVHGVTKSRTRLSDFTFFLSLMKIMAPPSKDPMQGLPHSVPPTLQQATADPRPRQRRLDPHRQVWVSLLGSLLLPPGSWCTRFCLCPPRVCCPGLCKFWWLYGGVNGDLLQEGLYHTQVCRTQSPCPCGSPLLTRTSPGDTQRQV